MPVSTLDQRVAHAHLAFALAVQRQLPSAGTTCWSPYSVASALGLAAGGARGDTYDELAALLVGSTGVDPAAHGRLLAEASSLPYTGSGEPPLLDVANTLWHDPRLSIRPEFLAELVNWPNPAVHEAPFARDTGKARDLINADVAATTHDLIRDLIGPGTLQPDTAAVLINALYLKTNWRNKFPASDTSSMPFHGPTGTSDVRTMRLQKQLGYAATDGWQVVTLPAWGDVEGVVLLPDGDIETESTLDADRLATLLAAPTPRLLQLYLPKFKVRAKTELNPALRGLGVHTMFDHRHADFSGISPDRLYVDTVIHEAVLTIDEDGLEGAAATAMVMRALAMHRVAVSPIVVHVDRPFLFLVRHSTTGAVYFLSRVLSP